ncbi:hypothetical protein [Pseudomonas fluorescens]|uniref:Uncharacterized protein n=1 Tax=Pseudomonas fluorescens TaxID=294 RepID=A0A5E7ECJ7_PSEFL|nr:hypothetical protein [Pseudomonas fluorescens]VVO24515.1 hypothetical protein PS710_04515 [Pseudomonas fluorescens]
MAKTVLHARREGVQFFMNTESSSPNSEHRNRYRLFKTENFGRDKVGWVAVGSIAGQALIATQGEVERFEACSEIFDSKRPRQYRDRGHIRGVPGKWEGEAFPARLVLIRDATVSASLLAILSSAAFAVSFTEAYLHFYFLRLVKIFRFCTDESLSKPGIVLMTFFPAIET